MIPWRPGQPHCLPADIASLIRLYLTTTYFQFGSDFNEQVEGVAMGTHLSPVVANIYMQDFAQKALRTAPLKPMLWLPYMDDTSVIWKHDDSALQSFLEHLSGQCAKSQFTMEKEIKGSISFLDVHMKKDGSNLTTSANRNSPTWIATSILYSSHHCSMGSLALQTVSITEPNRFANRDLPWQMKECMFKRFSWQMDA